VTAFAGRNVIVEASTTAGGAGSYTVIAEIRDVSMSHQGNNLDASAFGTQWMKRIQGIKDNTFSLSGHYDPTDTNGQTAIRSAWLNDTVLWFAVKWNGVNGFKQQVRVANFDVQASTDGIVSVSISLEGTDALAVI